MAGMVGPGCAERLTGGVVEWPGEVMSTTGRQHFRCDGQLRGTGYMGELSVVWEEFHNRNDVGIEAVHKQTNTKSGLFGEVAILASYRICL